MAMAPATILMAVCMKEDSLMEYLMDMADSSTQMETTIKDKLNLVDKMAMEPTKIRSCTRAHSSMARSMG